MGAQQGAYVRYPREELLAVIAAEAARTVDDDHRREPRHGARRGDARPWPAGTSSACTRSSSRCTTPTPCPPIPAGSVAGIRTHDMPAFAAAFDGDATGEQYEYRRLVADAVGHPVGDAPADVLDAALERLAASDAYADRRRRRRPDRRDRAPQRARPGAAVDVAAAPAAPRLRRCSATSTCAGASSCSPPGPAAEGTP